MAGKIARGEIRLYQCAAVGKTKDKKRPALVLTRNSALAYLSTVTVAPVTSTIRGVPSEVVLNFSKTARSVAPNFVVRVRESRIDVGAFGSRRCAPPRRFPLGCDSDLLLGTVHLSPSLRQNQCCGIEADTISPVFMSYTNFWSESLV